jgi:hypothetical protein
MTIDTVPFTLAKHYESAGRIDRAILTANIYTLTRHGVISEAFCTDWDAMTDCALTVEEVAANGYDRT